VQLNARRRGVGSIAETDKNEKIQMKKRSETRAQSEGSAEKPCGVNIDQQAIQIEFGIDGAP
jgi:hypothetical protein